MTLSREKIQIISFDLDDTLWDNVPVLAAAEQAMVGWIAIHCPKAATILNTDSLTHWKKQSFANKPESYDISALRITALQQLLLPLGYSQADVESAFEVFYQKRQQVSLFSDSEEALATLSKKFTLISLTNGNADVSQMPIDKYFTRHFTAQQLQAKKPQLEIYQRTQQALKIPPENILHIGDSLPLDIEPAIACGWQAIWFNPNNMQHGELNSTSYTQITKLSELSRLLLP